MTKITVDKALIEQAIEALEMGLRFRTTGVGRPPEQYNPPAVIALRAALAEPAVEPAEFVYVDHLGGTEVVIRDPQLPKSPTPPAEPRISTEHCSLAERQRHQASVNYPSDDLYCPRCQCSERFLQSRRCEPHIVYDTPPAEVPLLTPGEVALMWVSESFDTMSYESCYTRGVKRGEQAVRQRAWLK